MLKLNKAKPEDLAAYDYEDDNPDPPHISDPMWKVLIFDQFGKDLISTVLKVNDLRENGVTVHM